MKDKYQILSASFENGVSTITIKGYKGKKYTGTSKCHPDEKFPSEFFGGELAELRAMRKSLMEEKHEYDAKCDALRSVFFDIAGKNPDIIHISDDVRKISSHLRRNAEIAVKLGSQIELIDQRMKDMVAARARYMKNKYSD